MRMLKDQIFLLHYAGGNSYSYQFMLPYLSAFEPICLELPGRGKRMNEELIRDYNSALNDIYQQVTNHRNGKNFIIYGHSMGARLGLSLTKKLEDDNDSPSALFVTGNAGPSIALPDKKRHLMPRKEFILSLEKLGGIPKSLLENKDLFDFFEPILRADFEILETSTPEIDTLVKTPICAVMGTNETHVSSIEMWKKHTSSSFRHETLSGNHFFIHDHPLRLSELIKSSCDVLLVY